LPIANKTFSELIQRDFLVCKNIIVRLLHENAIAEYFFDF
jgi:hypothetical protein